jgi:hypothetical protein
MRVEDGESELDSSRDDQDQHSDDEIARRMERGIRQLLNTPPQPRGKNPAAPAVVKRKDRPAARRRVHKAKGRS